MNLNLCFFSRICLQTVRPITGVVMYIMSFGERHEEFKLAFYYANVLTSAKRYRNELLYIDGVYIHIMYIQIQYIDCKF